jgi:hypothetical protein
MNANPLNANPLIIPRDGVYEGLQPYTAIIKCKKMGNKGLRIEYLENGSSLTLNFKEVTYIEEKASVDLKKKICYIKGISENDRYFDFKICLSRDFSIPGGFHAEYRLSETGIKDSETLL